MHKGEVAVPTTDPDSPISEFILGRWREAEAYDPTGAPYPRDEYYEIEFLDEETLKQVRFDSSGAFVDGGMTQYEFVGDSLISVRDPRVSGQELWTLEKDGERLVVRIHIGDGSNRIVFERIIR